MNKKILVLVVSSFVLGAVYSAGAQQMTKSLPRIGFISSAATPGKRAPLPNAFQKELRDLGYVEGKNILIEMRYAEGRLDRMPSLVNELVKEKVNIILAVNNVVIQAAKKATKTIPIVIISSVDPVAAGYVATFAHPGGNITGFTHLGRDISAKRVELLREVIPKLSRLSVLWDANGPGPTVAFKEYEEAARAFKLDLHSLQVRGPNPDLQAAFQAAKLARAEAVIVVGNPLINHYKRKVFELATRNRLPTMAEAGRYATAGALISYGANAADLMRRAAGYVVEILKGAKPGDLPVKLPQKFEIFVNLKTAKQIGVGIPQDVLVQADKVIK